MIEISENKWSNRPKILVVGVGGAGNNAVNRMIESGIGTVEYVCINTDEQVLTDTKAQAVLQIGSKITNGYGAGANPLIGEQAAMESKDAIGDLVEEADMVIITCGLGGGTGTGASPVIARICKEKNILTVGVVTLPFSFEGMPRLNVARTAANKLVECVDTLLVIPNDKLISMGETNMDLDNAFLMADSVLKYTIEGIANIVFNRGTVNIDFNDLKTTLKDKGIGHLGIGIVEKGGTLLDAMKEAVKSPLLETNISGATNLLVNSSGKVNLMELNEAMSYAREIAGENVNIIWGTVNGEELPDKKIIVTLIATGMQTDNRELKTEDKTAPKKEVIKQNILPQYNYNREESEIKIPTFLSKYGTR